MKYLRLYNKFQKTGRLYACGLCSVFEPMRGDVDEIFRLVKPTDEDFQQLKADGHSSTCWGCGYMDNGDMYSNWEFSPLRQNLVLLMACLNGEEL